MAALATCKRLLGWLFGVGVLLATGWLAYHIAKAQPRCVIDSDALILHLSGDGNTVITGHQGIVIGNFTGGRGTEYGKPPLRVWDTRGGQLLRTLLDDVEQFERYAVCAKRPLLAVGLDGKVRLADWQTGKEWDVDVGLGDLEWLSFAPNGAMLFARVKGPPRSEMMIDVEAGKVVHHFDSNASGQGFSADGACWRFTRNNRMHDWSVATRKVKRDYPVGIFYCDDRIFVHPEPQDVGFVICDGASMAVISRIRPALPPMVQGRKIDAEKIDIDLRDKILSSRQFSFSPSGRRRGPVFSEASCRLVQRSAANGESETLGGATPRPRRARRRGLVRPRLRQVPAAVRDCQRHARCPLLRRGAYPEHRHERRRGVVRGRLDPCLLRVLRYGRSGVSFSLSRLAQPPSVVLGGRGADGAAGPLAARANVGRRRRQDHP